MSSAKTGSRLAHALLAYMVAVTLIVTLLPFRFRRPEEWQILLTGNALDIAANVLLFVPLGFFYRLATPSQRRGPASALLWIGALVSIAIEAAQLFLSGRDAAVLDVLANALGAWIGALAFDRLARSGTADTRRIGWLGFGLPVMGLVYLLVPLLCVSSLASGSDRLRLAAILLLGLFGAVLIGGVHRHSFGPSRAAGARNTALFAAAWFVAGTFPLLVSKPLYVLAGALLVLGSCWRFARQDGPGRGNDRRFELPLLKSAAPVYAAYLALVIVAPVQGGVAPWHVSIGFPPPLRIEILRLVELVAAFTLLGYMIAEFRSRAAVWVPGVVPYLLAWGAGTALLAEAVRGFEAGHGASIARGALLAAAALYGGWLYHLQRAHAMRLLSERVPAAGDEIIPA